MKTKQLKNFKILSLFFGIILTAILSVTLLTTNQSSAGAYSLLSNFNSIESNANEGKSSSHTITTASVSVGNNDLLKFSMTVTHSHVHDSQILGVSITGDFFISNANVNKTQFVAYNLGARNQTAFEFYITQTIQNTMISGKTYSIRFFYIDTYDCETYTDKIISHKYEAFVSLPSDPVKEGHTFVGWYFDVGLTQAYDGRPITVDTVLYAKFNVNKQTVSFNSNGGSSVSTKTTDWGTTISNPTTTREGYTFGGWYTDSGLTNQFNFATLIKQNYSLYAKWTINKQTVTFMVNGGSAVSNQVVNWGTVITNPTTSKMGYTFGGWYTDSNLTNAYNFSNLVKSDFNLYAKWTINRYTVSFEPNGGTAVTSQTVDYNTKLANVTITREGYEFGGWYTDSNFTVPFSFGTAITQSMTLYSKWNIKVYKVTFMVEGEVFKEIEVTHGTTLSVVVQSSEAKMFSAVYTDVNMTAFEGDIPVEQDIIVYAVLSNTFLNSSFILFVQKNSLIVILSLLILFVIIIIVILGFRKKKRG